MRKKIPTKQGSSWLTGLKFKKQSLAAISTQGSLTQTTRQGEAYTELPACTVFLPSEPAFYKGVLGILFQPIGLRLSLPTQTCAAPVNQYGSILTNQDRAIRTKQQESGVLIRMRTDQSGTRVGDFCPYMPAPPGSGSVLSLSTKD